MESKSTFCKIRDIHFSNNHHLSNRINSTDKSKKKVKTSIKDVITFFSKNNNEFLINKKHNTINNHNSVRKKIYSSQKEMNNINLIKNNLNKEITNIKIEKQNEKNKTITLNKISTIYPNKYNKQFKSKMRLFKYQEHSKNYKFLHLKKPKIIDINSSNSFSKERLKKFVLTQRKMKLPNIENKEKEFNFEEDNSINTRNSSIRNTIFGINNIRNKTLKGEDVVQLVQNKLHIHLSYLINDINLSDFNICRSTNRKYTITRPRKKLISLNKNKFLSEKSTSYKNFISLDSKRNNESDYLELKYKKKFK